MIIGKDERMLNVDDLAARRRTQEIEELRERKRLEEERLQLEKERLELIQKQNELAAFRDSDAHSVANLTKAGNQDMDNISAYSYGSKNKLNSMLKGLNPIEPDMEGNMNNTQMVQMFQMFQFM